MEVNAFTKTPFQHCFIILRDKNREGYVGDLPEERRRDLCGTHVEGELNPVARNFFVEKLDRPDKNK